MPNKKAGAKFTIQFNRTDPAHIHVADILNCIGRCGKAQYIVNAVLYYEKHYGVESGTKHITPTNEKYIEAVVNRILLNREACSAGILPAATPLTPLKQESYQPQPVEDIILDDAIETLSADGCCAVVSALEMFRKKQ